MAIKVVILADWSDCVGTDYCEALGIYDKLDDAWNDAADYAWDRWEPQNPEDYEDFEDEGPPYHIEEYDPEKHDCLKAGGGSFQYEFERMK